jgi:hypothetical protein
LFNQNNENILWILVTPTKPSILMDDETLTPQLCIPNIKTIPSKLWSVASSNQTVSVCGGGDSGRHDQNQSIPDFVRGYNYYSEINS